MVSGPIYCNRSALIYIHLNLSVFDNNSDTGTITGIEGVLGNYTAIVGTDNLTWITANVSSNISEPSGDVVINGTSGFGISYATMG